MSQSNEQYKDLEVIKATAQDLKNYVQKLQNHTTQAQDFCQYLKENYKISKKEVIADISGQTFSNINLNGIDLGTVIATQAIVGEEKTSYPVQFQGCAMNNVKLRSHASMQGLEFTHCIMNNMSLSGNINGVVFGIGSDIGELNLTEAYNIHKCVIDSTCKVSKLKLNFPDRNSLEQYVEKKTSISYKNTISHRRSEEVPDTPIVALPSHTSSSSTTEEASSRGIISYVGWGLWGAAVGIAKVTAGTASYVTSGVNYLLATNNNEEQQENSSPINSTDVIRRILDSSPSFSTSIEQREESNKIILTQSDIDNWIKFNDEKDKQDKLSLVQYIKEISGFEESGLIPYMENLNLQGRNFSDLDFGNVIISQCNFSKSKFERTNMNSLSARDCNFSAAIFSEVNASKTDFTRSAFCGTKIDKTTFEGSTMVDCNFSLKDLPTEISNSNLNYVDMRMANLDNTVLKNSSLNNINMEDAVGKNTIFFNVTINDSNLSGVGLTNLGIKDSSINNTIAYSANLEGAAINNVQITNFDAQEINLNNVNAQQLAIKDSDISHGTMNEARLAHVIIEGSNMDNLQAQEIKTYPEIIPVKKENDTEQNIKAMLADNFENKPSEQENSSYNVQKTEELASVLGGQEIPKGLSILNTNARAVDLSGSHMVNTHFDKVDASHAKIQNTVLQDSEIKDSNLHGANISGVNSNRTQIENTKLEGNNFTDVNLENVTMAGGTLKNSDISGANITNANIGTQDAKVDIEEIKGDIATNFAHSDFNTVNPKAKIEIIDPNGEVTSEAPSQLVVRSDKQEAIISNVPQQLIATAESKVSEFSANVSDFAENFSTPIAVAPPAKWGRYLGMVLGATIGVAATAFVASTLGLGLIPLAILGTIAVGGAALGGSVAGNFIQNTATGQNLLTTAYAMLTVTLLGPMATVVIPVMGLYNAITGKESPLRSAISTLTETFIAKPMKILAGGIGKITPSQKDVKEAQIVHEARKERSKHVQTESKQINAILPKHKHEHGIEMAKQQIKQEKQRKTPDLVAQKNLKHAATIQHSTLVKKEKHTWRDGVKPVGKSDNNLAASAEKLHTKPEIKKTFSGSHATTIKEQVSHAETVVKKF